MNNKKEKKEFAAKWDRRIRGQIRDAMKQHPEWFSEYALEHKNNVANSIAKRIIGEIFVGVGN